MKLIMRTLMTMTIFMSVIAPTVSFAAGVTSVEYDSATDSYTIHFDPNNVAKFSFKNLETGTVGNFDYSGRNYMDSFKCNTSFEMKFYNSSGNVISNYTGETTQVKNENASCKGDSGDSDGGSGSGSNCGCIFNTPGWNDYMGKVNQIISKIPSPPNWENVAEKFRDTIVPKMIGDMGDMLGRAPTPPRAPSLPPGPSKPDMPKNPGLKEPTGKDGIGNGGFTSDDIKNDAPVVEEREDPTGGFDILDPVGQLPSQDEFKDHVPDEGDMIPPEVPDVDAKAPTPPEQDNKAPKPPEQDNKAPGPPKDPENHAPSPGDVSGTAPTPPKQDNPAPGAPKDPENHAPNPGDTGATAPIPGGNTGSAPIPGDNTGNAPIPGNSGGTAPTPDKDNSTAPIPGGM